MVMNFHKMRNRLKHKLSRVITSFQLCRSKDPSCAEAPAPAIHRLSLLSTLKHLTSITLVTSQHHHHQHLITNAKCQGRPCPSAANANHDRARAAALGTCHPSCTDVAGEENETLLCSSRSFSYDYSCEFSHSLDTIARQSEYHEAFNKPIGNKKVSNVKKIKKLGHQVSLNKWKRSKTVTSPENPSPVRSSILKRVISRKVDGRVEESVAVVKKSQNPHRDFKRSMLEMILERQIFEAEDLEELLQCFLSLNSRQYHGVIVQAFSEVWEIVFCDSPV
ncbi:hypothetical protein POTOM_011228 [Populus tomentosa]|uniref:Transcription repressor n=1 Tax=Populus tomentosa TaxID=118781 RepID=A0A8X8DBC4_POPTO|nr:hypothetical protein POTOM_011228 [Populus tomentosa]